MTVTVATEGILDAAVARRILREVGLEAGAGYGQQGKHKLDRRLRSYNEAARYSRWLVLRDLDHDEECAPTLTGRLLPERAPDLRFRIAVRSVESWLLADRVRMSSLLGISRTLIPGRPDELHEPKETLVKLARRSRRRDVREDLVPAEGTSASVGPGFTSRMIEFAGGAWRPSVASDQSDSLKRCLDSLASWT